MKAKVYMMIGYNIELPDDWCDRCRKMQEELGENYIGKNWGDEDILSYIAHIYGLRGIHWLETVGEDMSNEIKCELFELDYMEDEIGVYIEGH